jgi:hypothetical protein
VDGDALVEVSVVAGRFTVRRLASLGEAQGALDRIRLAIRAGRGVAAAARVLQGHVLDPIGDLAGIAGLVVVAPPDLERVCWAELPACRGLPVSVSPSISAWLRASTRPCAAQPRVWIAGPGLAHAEREVRTLAARYGGQALVGSEARVEAVRGALPGASTAHLAAHGRVRSDAAGSAGIRMADGVLCDDTLEGLDRVPAVVVLSACGAAGGRLSPALQRMGTRSVIASVSEVSDEAVAGLMSALHEGLAAGTPPAAALARAQRDHGPHGFNCYGA